jgi:hypothetical protein
MTTFLLTSIPETLWHDALAVGRVTGDGFHVEVTGEIAQALQAAGAVPVPAADADNASLHSSGGQPAVVVQEAQPIPRAKWPAHIKALALLARPEDRGIGDVIARTVGPIGGDLYKEWHQKIFGKPCGCSDRQDNYNQLYPLQ